MDNSNERMRILELIEGGKITTEEGLRLLSELPDVSEIEADAAEQVETAPDVIFGATASTADADGFPAGEPAARDQSYQNSATSQASSEPIQPEVLPPSQPDWARWKSYWMIPLWIGVGVTVVGGLLMYWAVEASGIGFWFYCASIPMILGVLLIVLAIQSRTAHWLHLRVRQSPGERPQNINISFPIPINFTRWFIRTFRHRIPGMDNVPANADEILEAVKDGTSPDSPVYIQVDDEDGEKVEIFIG